MRKKIIRVLLFGAMALVWLAAFFFQHLSCFDIFETNAPRLYALACGFAVVQSVVLVFVARWGYPSWLFIGYGLFYGIGAFLAAKILLTAHLYNPMPLGLSICSLSLDVASFALCVLLFICVRKEK